MKSFFAAVPAGVRAAVVLAVCCALLGCTTLTHVNVQREGATAPAAAPTRFSDTLAVGDKVDLTLRDGSTVRLRVTSVSADEVVGTLGGGSTELKRYDRGSVESFDRITSGRGKTILLGILGGIVGVILLGMASGGM